MKNIFANRTVGFYLNLASTLLAFVLTVYYVIQSNVDGCFNIFFVLPLAIGIALNIAHIFVKFDMFVAIGAALIGIAFGIMVHDMLPSLSDVWNGVTYIGGNLNAYLVYTIVSFISGALAIVSCFIGTGEANKNN